MNLLLFYQTLPHYAKNQAFAPSKKAPAPLCRRRDLLSAVALFKIESSVQQKPCNDAVDTDLDGTDADGGQ